MNPITMPAVYRGTNEEKLYRAWINMFVRCSNPNNRSYHRYGGRGIRICAEWVDYEVFRDWAKSSGYQEGLVLDRRNNDGNYTPENCRWITLTESLRNTSLCRFVTAFGETKTEGEWAQDERCSVNQASLSKRLAKGMSPEDAITLPDQRGGRKHQGLLITAFGETKRSWQWIEDARCKVSRHTLEMRLRSGWTPEFALSEPSRQERTKLVRGVLS
jgi:hypothetical protein